MTLLDTLGSVAWTYRHAPPSDRKAAFIGWLVGVSRARQLAREHVTHVHAHFDWSSLSAWVATRLEPRPFTFTLHATDLYKQPAAFRRRARSAYQVVTISEYNRRLLTEAVPEADGKVQVIRCGVDPAQFRWHAPRRDPDRVRVSLLRDSSATRATTSCWRRSRLAVRRSPRSRSTW